MFPWLQIKPIVKGVTFYNKLNPSIVNTIRIVWRHQLSKLLVKNILFRIIFSISPRISIENWCNLSEEYLPEEAQVWMTCAAIACWRFDLCCREPTPLCAGAATACILATRRICTLYSVFNKTYRLVINFRIVGLFGT